MNRRATSLAAILELRESGKLSERRAEALAVLVQEGPGTAAELDAAVRGRVPGLWKRLSELRRAGYAKEIAVRTCSVTGHTAIVWSANVGERECQKELFR